MPLSLSKRKGRRGATALGAGDGVADVSAGRYNQFCPISTCRLIGGRLKTHRTFFLLPTLLLLSSVQGFAQFERKPEIFVGYSNLQAEGLPDRDNSNTFFSTDFLSRRGSMHGVNIEGTVFPSETIGATGDLSFTRQGRSVDVNGSSNSEKTDIAYFMAGPSMNLRNSEHLFPFVRIMLGAAHLRYKASNKQTISAGTFSSSFETGSTDFTLAFGGGVDLKAGERFKVRIVQIDYAPIFLGDRSVAVLGTAGALLPVTLEGQRQDNFRFSFGIVF
jgi:opacity protein-like surface antigen